MIIKASAWSEMIESCFPKAKKVTRYAMKKDTQFNEKKLQELYLKYGRGMVILKDNEIVSGASSYTRYLQGIEIEVDTIPSERRKHLATAACSALILDCLKKGLYPSWDAQNINSVYLAEKLGYEFSHEYTAYEI